jgi:hypothetical protein
MISDFSDVTFRLRLCPQSLVRTLIGVGCLRVILPLSAGSGPSGVSLAATAVQWTSRAASPIVLAPWDWDVQKHQPGIRSLLRKLSCGAIAGSLLACAASLLLFTDLGAAALAGLALTLFSATLLEWLPRDIGLDAPPLSESMAMARLTALQEIAEHCVRGTARPEAVGR